MLYKTMAELYGTKTEFIFKNTNILPCLFSKAFVALCPHISPSLSVCMKLSTPPALLSSPLLSSPAWHPSSFSRWPARPPEPLSLSCTGSPSPSLRRADPPRHPPNFGSSSRALSSCHLTTNRRDGWRHGSLWDTHARKEGRAVLINPLGSLSLSVTWKQRPERSPE